MSKIVLQPCSVRDGCLVFNRNETPVTLTWQEFCCKFAPQKERAALKALSRIAPSYFVGLVKKVVGGTSVFVYHGGVHSGNLRPILSRDPGYATRIQCVYSVVEVDLGRSIEEARR